MPIRILAPEVAACIAAGEVVERPASVVKELVENSLDAGAARIAVEVTAGGLDSIRVTDDGFGIEAGELLMAFERHATSKLADDADLARVLTLGFRGEALPSIAAVVSHNALAYPEVRFSLTRDGRQSFGTPGSGDLRDAVAAVYGLETAAEMLVVDSPDGPAGVDGLVGPPSLSRASRGYISLFVNRRWIQNRRLAFAVEQAYQGMLMASRHPLAVLNITCPYEDVDVNVHPTKAEVRFQDESAVFAAVQRTVRMSLVARTPVPSGVSAGAGLVLSPEPWTPPLWERGFRRDGAAPPHSAAGDLKVAPTSRTNIGNGASLTPAAMLPVLRVIGQFGGVYIIAEGPDGMYMIDQHAAHERVLYERFCLARANRMPDAQGLLEPLAMELPPRLRTLVAAETEALAAHGFAIEPFGEASLIVRSLPAQLVQGDVREAVVRFLEVMLEEDEGDGRDRVAMSLACHGAIRAGKTLSPEEMRQLVLQMEAAASPHTCPHGRPTMVHMSAEALARGFGRR